MDELTEAVLGVAVDELVPDLLVDDTAHAGELAIERHAVVGRLEDEAAGRRGGRARRAAAERKRPVSERRDAARQEDELARIDLGRQSDPADRIENDGLTVGCCPRNSDDIVPGTGRWVEDYDRARLGPHATRELREALGQQ